MNRKPPLLTVAIPTYNSPSTLRLTLESVIAQLPDLGDGLVNIEVFDNASTDQFANTSVMEISEGLVEYHTATKNAGYDRNIIRCLTESKGTFIKILADDDVLAPGALAVLLQNIENFSDLGLIIHDFDKYDSKLQTKVQSNLMKLSKPEIFSSENGLAASMGRFGQVSTLVFKKSTIQSSDLSAGIGSNYVHILAAHVSASRAKTLLIPFPLVKVREGSPNFSYSPLSHLDTVMNGLKVPGSLTHLGFTKKYQRKLRRSQQETLIQALLHVKKLGLFDFRTHYLRAWITSGGSLLLVLIGPLLLIPRIFIKSLSATVKWYESKK